MKKEKEELKKEYGVLYYEISEILFEQDPISINFGDNTDEYEPEVETILPRLKKCHSFLDVRKVVHEEFVNWFSKEDAGPEEYYDDIAKMIWMAWQQYLLKTA